VQTTDGQKNILVLAIDEMEDPPLLEGVSKEKSENHFLGNLWLLSNKEFFELPNYGIDFVLFIFVEGLEKFEYYDIHPLLAVGGWHYLEELLGAIDDQV
jgi:hypothetical protein